MHLWARFFYPVTILLLLVTLALAYSQRSLWWLPIIPGGLLLISLRDLFQRKHTIRRNFPIIGNFRYWLEAIRPEINQYFIESETDGRPFSREMRSVVYQRAKDVLDTRPFGTVRDLYEEGTEWMVHSIAAHEPYEAPLILIGRDRCEQPYACSLLNISAMSFGSLSRNAVEALNLGARMGRFAHNTGEGGISPYHLKHGGDLIWQLGTGYFGARSPDGNFDSEMFKDNARRDSVKMIEVKLSQGAKPGHGGILPAAKVTKEISEIRGVPMGKDVISPPYHTAFDSPIALLKFITELRELSGGKPIGFKLCVGKPDEFLGICKAMIDSGLRPDFITVDGSEGGTGAAPIEFSNAVGSPLTEGLVFVHNALTGAGVRSEIKVIAAGKVVTGFHMAQRLALGADVCNSARAMMFAIGCIQALRCNNNHCPTGVATQNPALVKGLDVQDKAERTAEYHKETVESLMELLGASGIAHPDDLRPRHIFRRISHYEVKHYGELYGWLKPGQLLNGDALPHFYEEHWKLAHPHRF